MNKSHYKIQVGVVGKGHGLTGAFYISGRTEPLPDEVKLLTIGKDSATRREYKLDWKKTVADRIVVKCQDVNSRDDADRLRHQFIWIDRAQLAVVDEVEYCWADLLDKQVVDAKGVELGTISQVNNYGAGDIIRIESPDGKSYLEIPLGPFYVDMSFRSSDQIISLCVEKDTFDECWQS